MKNFFLLAVIVFVTSLAHAAYQLQALKELLQTYSRPVSVLDLSKSAAEISTLSKQYPTSVFVTRHGAKEKNHILFSKNLNVDDIKALSCHEHFDVACFFGSFPHKQAMIRALLRLADFVLLEIPEDLHDLLSDFLFKLDAQILTRQNEHFLIVISRQEPKHLTGKAIGVGKDEIPVMTSRHYALLKTPEESLQLPPGLSLYGYRIIEGNYPDLETLKQLLQEYSWQPTCACLPWNILLQGTTICYLPRYKEPKSWSKEALKKCLDGLQLESLEEFKTRSIEHLQTIGLHR